MENFKDTIEVKKDTSGVDEALDEVVAAPEMNKLLSDAQELIKTKTQETVNSPEFQARLQEIGKKAEIAKKTPAGTSPQYNELAKLLLEMGYQDVTTQQGRERLILSTQNMLDNARNAMRAERETFENQVSHFVNMITESEDFKNATDKAGILNNVMAGIAADIDHGNLSDEEKKVMGEVVSRLKQLA